MLSRTPYSCWESHIIDRPISYRLPSGQHGQQLGQGWLLMFLSTPWESYARIRLVDAVAGKQGCADRFFKISTNPILLRSLPSTASLNSASWSGGNGRLAFDWGKAPLVAGPPGRAGTRKMSAGPVAGFTIWSTGFGFSQ